MTIDVPTTAGVPAALARCLAPDEKLIWWDQPQPKLLGRHEMNAGLFFGLFFFAFSLFWITTAARGGGAFALLGIPFVLTGLWLVSAPLRAYWRAASMAYGLTDRRALVLSGATVSSFPLDRIEFVETAGEGGAAGHVLFYKEAANPFGPLGWNNGQQMRKSGFLAVAEAERVSRELLAAIEEHRISGRKICDAAEGHR